MLEKFPHPPKFSVHFDSRSTFELCSLITSGQYTLNPFIKLTTNIVYKVPNELSGDVYWKPGRNAEDKKRWRARLRAA